MKNPLMLPSGPTTRSHAKKHGATMENKGAWIPQLLTKIRGRIFSRKRAMIRNGYHSNIEPKEAWGTPKFLTLMEAHVELEPEFPAYGMPRQCYVSTPVQGGTPKIVHSSDLPRKIKLHEARPCQIARPRSTPVHGSMPQTMHSSASHEGHTYMRVRPCQSARPGPCNCLALARDTHTCAHARAPWHALNRATVCLSLN
ncbi:hypothetical protein JCGZ_08820 [Jatropha curcas]|uniref:Uncharacterized protein n=1 Tax=Jatropha curcas TaxID=180498 RepID=A0A067KIX3_JATCU|nr:hypothetical protein JCGZ_08820 [Jatropha curcas]